MATIVDLIDYIGALRNKIHELEQETATLKREIQSLKKSD